MSVQSSRNWHPEGFKRATLRRRRFEDHRDGCVCGFRCRVCVELRFANERNASEADFGDASLEQGWFRWPDDCIRAGANVYGLGADYHR